MQKIDIDKLLEGRQPVGMDELNQLLLEEMHRLNSAPIPEFCGVSPDQMQFLLYQPFAEGSPFRFRVFDPTILDNCPFFLLAENMLRISVLQRTHLN